MPILIPAIDDTLAALGGAEIQSTTTAGVSYRVGKQVGSGGLAVAFLAVRSGPEGQCTVVLKIARPSIVRQSPHNASLLAQKEAVALQRLNDRVPTTPFVVRLFDIGDVAVEQSGKLIELPWLAVEYVHGGAEGTTLTERVKHSLRATGYAFNLARAARAIDCLSKGLTMVHDVDVIHRDIKPDNVLCCGFGDAEIFKISDFGVARPVGFAATFGGLMVGTPGYAPLELLALDQQLGPWTDVFGLAGVVFYVLTGERYFAAQTAGDAIALARDPKRRSVMDTASLSPDLRHREAACRAIDHALAGATAVKGRDRPQTADAFAVSILRWLSMDVLQPRTMLLRAEDLGLHEETLPVGGWSWITRQQPSQDRLFRDVAWDGDGQCLVITSRGLSFWNGTSFRDAPLTGVPTPDGIRFIRRTGPGRWILGFDGGTFCIYTSEGVTEVMAGSNNATSLQLFSGEIGDIAVGVGVEDAGPPTLYALVGRRWLKPLPLPDVATVTALARVDDAHWLLGGRYVGGTGFTALYSPLDWDVQRFETSATKSFLRCAGQADQAVGLSVGTEGVVAWYERGRVEMEIIPGKHRLSAAAVDAAGRGWAGAAGRLWLRETRPNGGGQWDCVWEDPAWTSPMVSIFADVDVVVAMMADGGIVEGRYVDLLGEAE